MARQLDALPGGEIQEDLPPGLLQFFFDELDFLLKADARANAFPGGPQVIQLGLQFDDRLLEIELMFHAWRDILAFLTAFRQWKFTGGKIAKAGLASGLRGDEVNTPSPRRSEGRRDQLGVAVRAAPQAKPLCQP
jgi:hypothetical protein